MIFLRNCSTNNVMVKLNIVQSELVKLESNYQLASCFPDETLGVFRVPLGAGLF